MKRIWMRILPVIISLLFVTACSGQQQSNNVDYSRIKSMVVDILKTKEGKEALKEAQKDDAEEQGAIMQMLTTPEGQQIQIAVKEILTDPQYSRQLQTMMTDPKFAGEFAKAVQKENKQIHKDLMKDPEYQTMLLGIMKDPEYEKLVTDIMKGKEYRQQTMTIMQEALQNPLFKIELLELLKTALKEELEEKSSKSGKKSSEGGDGGSGGGGSGSNTSKGTR